MHTANPQPTPIATLTERQLALIHALQRTPRAPWTAIANQLKDGSTPRYVAKQWDSLYDARVAWLTPYPGPRSWRNIQIVWVTATPLAVNLRDAVSTLAGDGAVMSLDIVYGGAILASVATPSVDHLNDWLVFGPLANVRPQIDVAVHLHTSAARWRIGTLPGDDTRTTGIPSGITGSARIPPRDRVRAMIDVLAPDPRAPTHEIAKQLDEPERNVRRWLTEMLHHGDLDIRVELAPAAVGRPVGVHWWLSSAAPDRLVEVLVGQRDVRWVASVVPRTGSATTLAAAWVSTTEAVHSLMTSVLRASPGSSTERLSMTWQPVKRLGWRVDQYGRRVSYVPLVI